jgi:hypothetical protein
MNWLQQLTQLTRPVPPVRRRKSPLRGKREAPPEPTSVILQPFASPLPGLETIQFGHFSDTNNSPAHTEKRTTAIELFRSKKYRDSLQSLLDWIQSERGGNAVKWKETGPDSFDFILHQSTRLIEGNFDGKFLHACVPLAKSDAPGTAVMRRMLELNNDLQYTSAGLDKEGIFYLVFDTDADTASPQKVFNGLRELALVADRQDDDLRIAFPDLLPVPSAPITQLPAGELEVKSTYFHKWIGDTLAEAENLDMDAYAGAIAHLLLTLVYRLDLLLSPDGRLMLELEQISNLYWADKDEKTLVSRNAAMLKAVHKLQSWTTDDLAAGLHLTEDTFAGHPPPNLQKVRDTIVVALRDAAVYAERSQPFLELTLLEYGPLANQYLYAMPDLVRDLTLIQQAVLHPHFFADLGMSVRFYDEASDKVDAEAVARAVGAALQEWKVVFPRADIDFSKINFTSRAEFAGTFAAQLSVIQL